MDGLSLRAPLWRSLSPIGVLMFWFDQPPLQWLARHLPVLTCRRNSDPRGMGVGGNLQYGVQIPSPCQPCFSAKNPQG